MSGTSIGNATSLAAASLQATDVIPIERPGVKTPYRTTLSDLSQYARANLLFARDYGAVPDGVTDSTTAIQVALDDCDSKNGGVVLLDIGTYLTTSTLQLPYPCVLQGVGQWGSTINYTGTGTAVVIKDKSAETKKYSVCLRDLKIDAPNAAVGLDLSYAMNSVYENVWVKGSDTEAEVVTGSIGILMYAGKTTGEGGAWWNKFDHVQVRNWETGIVFDGVDESGQANENVVINSYITQYSKYGVDVRYGDHVTIMNNDISDTWASTASVRVTDTAARIINNRFEGTDATYNIIVEPHTSATPHRNTLIKDNVFTDSKAGGANVWIKASTQPRVVIKDNHVTGGILNVLDESTNTQEYMNLQSGLVPFHFFMSNVAANLTGAVVYPVGVAASLEKYYPLRRFQVRGITAYCVAAITTGTIAVNPYMGSTNSDLTATITSTSSGLASAFQGLGIDEGVSTTLGCKVTTSADLDPAGAVELLVTIYIEFVRD